MEDSITPTNITGAAQIAQLCILVIMGLGIGCLALGHNTHLGLTAPVLALALVTFAVLFLSHEMADIWRPLFGRTTFSGPGSSIAIPFMFTCDAVAVTWLVHRSRGSMHSPFTAIYFVIPAIAIFLREPFLRVAYYLVLVGTLFSWNCKKQYAPLQAEFPLRVDNSQRFAYWLVAILCFGLTTFIGYLTRPAA